MTYTCHYRHIDGPYVYRAHFPRLHDPVRPPQDAEPPALVPVPNGRHEIIAYRCPVCQRAWAALPAVDIGRRGAELLPVDAKARRAKMMEALE